MWRHRSLLVKNKALIQTDLKKDYIDYKTLHYMAQGFIFICLNLNLNINLFI